MRIISMIRSYAHLKRYRTIANVLAKHGFGFIVDQFGFSELLSLPMRLFSKKTYHNRLQTPERLRLVFEELGATYIKLGQLLSTRPDLVSAPIAKELGKLQDFVKPLDYAEIEETIQSELGSLSDEIIQGLSTAPMASASIGQVHSAILLDGTAVIVKIRRPGIEQIVKTDLEILEDLAQLAQKRSIWAAQCNLVRLVNEFADGLREELDLSLEASNTARFKESLENQPDITVPGILWKYSTQKVLVQERINGVKITDIQEIKERGWSPSAIAHTLATATFRQIFETGLFHADPHPGNVLAVGYESIAYMDFGLMGYVDASSRRDFVHILLGITTQDLDLVIKALTNLGSLSFDTDISALKRDIQRLQRRYYYAPLKHIQLESIINDIFRVFFTHRIQMPSDFVLLAKTLITVEGIVRQLDSSVSIANIATVFVKSLMKRQISIERLAKSAKTLLIDCNELLATMPRKLDRLVDTVLEGQLRITHNSTATERFVRNVDRLSKRLALSIVVASLIIGTALVTHTDLQALIGGFPLAKLGFILSLAAGFWFFLTLLKAD